MSRSARRAIVGCGALLLACAGHAAAQTATEGELPPEELPPEKQAAQDGGNGSKNEGRELSGHLFIPSELVPDPFVPTYFRSTSGYGYIESTGPNFDRLGNFFGSRDFKQALLTQSFELQVGPLDWLALRIGATSVVYSGVDAPSVLSLGANVDLHGRAGLTLTLPKATWVRPALVFDAEHGPAYEINLLSSVQASIEAGEIVRASALSSGELTVLTPGVSAAFAIHRSFGLVLNALYVGRTGSDIDPSRTADGFSLGFALDVDFKAISFVPIGLMGAFRWIDQWEGNFEAEQEGNLGVYYTARPALVLGLLGGVRNIDQGNRPRFESTIWLALVTMRYYW